LFVFEVLAVHTLIADPKDDVNSWLGLATLCRKEGMLSLCENLLRQLGAPLVKTKSISSLRRDAYNRRRGVHWTQNEVIDNQKETHINQSFNSINTMDNVNTGDASDEKRDKGSDVNQGHKSGAYVDCQNEKEMNNSSSDSNLSMCSDSNTNILFSMAIQNPLDIVWNTVDAKVIYATHKLWWIQGMCSVVL
jgi:hypothetical protein